MELISRNPLIVEVLYDNCFKVKVVLSSLFDKYLIEYIEKHDIKEGANIDEYIKSNIRTEYIFALLNPEE